MFTAPVARHAGLTCQVRATAEVDSALTQLYAFQGWEALLLLLLTSSFAPVRQAVQASCKALCTLLQVISDSPNIAFLFFFSFRQYQSELAWIQFSSPRRRAEHASDHFRFRDRSWTFSRLIC